MLSQTAKREARLKHFESVEWCNVAVAASWNFTKQQKKTILVMQTRILEVLSETRHEDKRKMENSPAILHTEGL